MSPRRHLTDAFKYLGRHLPVNKTYGQKPNPVNIPQVRNPLVLGTIGVGATVSAALYRVMRNRPELELARALEAALSDFSGVEAACVRVQKGMASRRLNIQIQAVEGVDVERAQGLVEDVLSVAAGAVVVEEDVLSVAAGVALLPLPVAGVALLLVLLLPLVAGVVAVVSVVVVVAAGAVVVLVDSVVVVVVAAGVVSTFTSSWPMKRDRTK